MKTSVTIYSKSGFDESLATATLATALLNKGSRIYVEFLSNTLSSPVVINSSYVVGVPPSNNLTIVNSTAILYIPPKNLGVVVKYDDQGKSEVLMRFSNVNSLTNAVLDYVETLNAKVELPEQLLKDVILYNQGQIDKMSKVGKAIAKAVKMNYGLIDFTQKLYTYLLEVIKTRSYKLNPDIAKEAEKYDVALRTFEELLNAKEYIQYGNIKVFVISRQISKEAIKNNYAILKPIAYDILVRLCREDGISMVVLETELGHTLRICLGRRDVSFVNIVSSIRKDLSEKLDISLKGNHVLIKFKNPSESNLDRMLEVVDDIATGIVRT